MKRDAQLSKQAIIFDVKKKIKPKKVYTLPGNQFSAHDTRR